MSGFIPDEPVLLTPDNWCMLYHVQVLDPDGWRGANHKLWSVPITLEEFIERFNRSTARGHENLPSEVRGKNTHLNDRSTIHYQGAIMAEQTETKTETSTAKEKVSWKTRFRNFNAKHPRLPKAAALVVAALFGAGAYKVSSERKLVNKETLAELEAEANSSASNPETTTVTEV